jgi:hypothetical protein
MTCAPLPRCRASSSGTTKHLTRLTNYISQVIANPANGRGLFTSSSPAGVRGLG